MIAVTSRKSAGCSTRSVGTRALQRTRVDVSHEDARTIRLAIEDYLPMVEQWLCEATKLRTRREHRDSVQAMWTLLAALPQHLADDEKAA